MPVTVRPALSESLADRSAFWTEGERRQNVRERAEKKREAEVNRLRESFESRLTEVYMSSLQRL